MIDRSPDERRRIYADMKMYTATRKKSMAFTIRYTKRKWGECPIGKHP